MALMGADTPGLSSLDGDGIGDAMRLARRRLGLSQRDLARAVGWDRSKVGRWESGAVPEGFDEVVALLRVLGFGVVLTDPGAARWAAWDEPAEHVRDRARRRFPAHLELCAEAPVSTWNWTRHRGEPSPLAALNAFRRRTRAEAVAEEEPPTRDPDAPAATAPTPDEPSPTAQPS